MDQPRTRRRNVIIGAIVVVLLFIGLLNLGSGDSDDGTVSTAEQTPTTVASAPAVRTASTPSPTPTSSKSAEDDRDRDPSDAETESALRMLYGLDVKGRAPKTGYDRDHFGWRDDVDGNGCDTRNDVLRRDLTNITLKSGGCVVLGGTLTSDFTGDTFKFIRGDGNNIDIDHMVSLSNAWQTGAQQLSDRDRLKFGNDPINLIAVESSVNRSKSDGDAATWLPPRKSYRCEYVARQIRVKHDYDLWVTPPEFDAMESLLLDCDEVAFGEDDWPDRDDGEIKREPKSKPAPPSGSGSSSGGSAGSGSSSGRGSSGSGSSGSGSSGGSVYYKNCDAARAAGADPVYVGDPGYAKHLDRDGDGIGCE